MDPKRRLWNQQQKSLRSALLNADGFQAAIDLFLQQHAMVHSARMAQSGLWSFEDEIWQGLPEQAIREIPPRCDHSIAWITWHMARIEDVTMNLLVGHSPQVFNQNNWLERLKVNVYTTGNMMDRENVASLSAALDIEMLREYRIAVGCRTREIVYQLRPEQLTWKVEPGRLQQVLDEGAVVEEAKDLIAYWGSLNVAGLLLMPPTRHNFVHLNEALRVKFKSRH